MNIVKYKIGLIAAIAALLFGFLPVAQVSAGNIADITFKNSRLFDEADFMPGDSASEWVRVKNKVNDNLVVTTAATNIMNSDQLGDQINLIIRKGATILYNDTMTAFFSAGNVNLGSLVIGETGQFDYLVTFNSQADNSWQSQPEHSKTMGFDISVTAQAAESVGGETYTVASSGGGGGGGGMAYTINELNLNNLGVAADAQAADTSIIVAWLTNKSATSRVIYDTVTHSDLSLALSPNYGYANSTVLDPTEATSHAVPITGLTPGTTYYLRLLSSASPEKYSSEIAIATTGLAPVESGTSVQADNVVVDNNKPETASVKPEVLGIKILGAELAPTGFSQSEFIGLLVILSVLIGFIIILRERYQI